MLKLVKMSDPASRWTLLSRFDPQSERYVVSDVKTKMAAEAFLLQTRTHLVNSPVLRLQEFLRIISYHLKNCYWQFLPESFLREIFADFTLKHKEVFIQNSSRSKDFFLYFYRFFPLLLHSEGPDVMKEWLESRGKKVCWTRWWDLSQEFFSLLSDQNRLPEKCLKAVLTEQLQLVEFLPFKKVIFDLGLSFDKGEAEFIKELSKKCSVDLIVPDIEKAALYPALVGGKKLFQENDFQNARYFGADLGPLKVSDERDSKSFLQIVRRRSTSSLSEVKEAISQVLRWRKQGVLEDDIVLLAPDMEAVWFCLKPHLNRKRIAFRKGEVSALIDNPKVLLWLSELRLHLNLISFPDLETRVFSRPLRQDFSVFYRVFSKVPERKLSKKYLHKGQMRNREERITGEEFIKWAVFFWPKRGEAELLDQALESFKDLPLTEKLSYEGWLRILESELFSLKPLSSAEPIHGISCLSLNALSSVQGSHVFILGLDQESLSALSLAGSEDMEKLSEDLGFSLPLSHPRQTELNLLWFLQSSHLKEVILSFADWDFSGLSRTASLLWQFFESDSGIRKDNREKLPSSAASPLKRLSENPKKKATSFAPFFQKNRHHFSPRSLAKYVECPFAYAVEYVFHIKSAPQTDREMSSMNTGLMTHLLFAKLFERKDFQNWKTEEISCLIDDLIENSRARESQALYDRQWLVLKHTLQDQAQGILAKEQQLFSQFPKLHVLKQELPIECFWQYKHNDFSSEGDILFKGRIDRLDYDPVTHSYLIRDYKNSLDQISHIDGWMKKKEMQLLLYADVLEKGLIKGLPPGKVRVLDYYSYKDFAHKGYVEKGSCFEGIFGNRWRGYKDRGILDKAFKDLKVEISRILSAVEKGLFSPIPFNQSTCETCSWRKWCRASHLN